MALIPCPECGKEISDKVKACPHCGYPLAEERANESTAAEQIVQAVVKKHRSPLFLIIGAMLIIALVAFAAVYAVNAQKEKAYIDKLELAATTMKSSIPTAENILNLVGQIWYNAIWEEYDANTNLYTRPDGYWVGDFNIALANYYASDEADGALFMLRTRQTEVQAIMQDLQNPPNKLQAYHDTATDLFVAYQSVINFAMSPSGSLNTFADSKNAKLDKFNELFDKLMAQLPD